MTFYRTHKTQIGALIRLGLILASIGYALAHPHIGIILAIAPVALGSLKTVAVLGHSTVTNTGPTVVQGDLDLSPGTSIVGFPPGIVHGTIHDTDSTAAQAQVDLTAAIADAGGRGGAVAIVGDLGGQTLTTGVYSAAAAQGLTGVLTLNGSPTDVWIFQIGTALTVAGSVVFTGGALAKNVFWNLGSSATIGVGSIMQGTILATASVTLATGAVLHGRALASTGAVSMDTNAIDVPGAGGFGLTCGMADGYLTIPYSSSFVATGGTPPYTFNLASGVLPIGLSLNPSTGLVSGIPTQMGTFTFTINATDSNGFTSPVVCSITIHSAARAGSRGGPADCGCC
jgi:type VI secretion system secreted protein VgrG